MAIKTNPNPRMLVWARNQAGLTLEKAARKSNLSSKSLDIAVAKLRAFEAGEERPTQAQLSRLADIYYRPLLTLYSKKPPKESGPIPDFRQVYGPVKPEPEIRGRLDALLRKFWTRHRMVRSLFEQDQKYSPLGITGSIRLSDGVSSAAGKLREALQIRDDDTIQPGPSTSKKLFQHLRMQIEQLGVFVFLAGNLGSWHTKIPVSAFRGFAIADDYAPFIVVNSTDAWAARCFTLMHELVHVFLGRTGISAQPSPDVGTRTEDARVEHFCNDVAAEILVPETLVMQRIERDQPVERIRQQIQNLAAHRGVSRAMVAYRLRRLGIIDSETYQEVYQAYVQEWLSRQQGGFGLPQSREEKLQMQLGIPLIQLIQRSINAKDLTYTKAAILLGLKMDKVEELLEIPTG